LYFKSARGKKVLKFSLILVVVVLVLAGGLYTYASYVKKESFEKYSRAQDLYLQAIGKEGKEKIEDLEKAAKLFKEVTSHKFWSYNKEETLFYLADCFYRLGNLEKSIEALKELQEKYSSGYFYPWVRLKMALIYEQMEEYKKAIKVYRGIQERFSQTSVAPEALLGEARCQELTGNKEEALKIYQNLISRYPLSPQAEIAEAKLQHLSQKKG